MSIQREASSGVLLEVWWLDTPASREARMNHVLRNYT